MNKRQRAILIEVASVLILTAVAVVAMINFKDYINRSESIKAMTSVGQIIAQYQREYNRVPPESVVLTEMRNIPGAARLPGIVYRGLWINLEAEPNDILAYAEKNYPASLFDDGYVVLRFDSNVVWMDCEEFEALLAQQQTEMETKTMRK